MFFNHLTLALRYAWRNRRYTLLNVFGLAAGVSCCLLIGLYLLDEIRYDRFWPGSERVFRINQTNAFEEERSAATVSVPVGPAVVQGVSGVEAMTRWFIRPGAMRAEVRRGESPKLFQEAHVVLVDSGVFRVFAMNLLTGDPNLALNAPRAVVLSQSTARRYFGTENPVGRTLRYENRADLTVTGVFADLPHTTDLRADFLVRFETLFDVEAPDAAEFMRKDWLFNPTQTYLRLRPNTDPAKIQPQLDNVLRRSGDERVAKHVRLSLQSLHDTHLHSAELSGFDQHGQHPVRAAAGRYRRDYLADCLLQFHQPHHGVFAPAGEGGGHAQGPGRVAGVDCRAIFGGNAPAMQRRAAAGPRSGGPAATRPQSTRRQIV